MTYIEEEKKNFFVIIHLSSLPDKATPFCSGAFPSLARLIPVVLISRDIHNSKQITGSRLGAKSIKILLFLVKLIKLMFIGQHWPSYIFQCFITSLIQIEIWRNIIFIILNYILLFAHLILQIMVHILEGTSERDAHVWEQSMLFDQFKALDWIESSPKIPIFLYACAASNYHLIWIITRAPDTFNWYLGSANKTMGIRIPSP